MILDLQAASENYWSDLGRTFVVGEPSPKQVKALETVIKAKERTEEYLRPGTKGKEVYEAVSEVLIEAGFSKLIHHAGHSVGLDAQEAPFFIPNNEEELEEGMVCPVEPGIYDRSVGGMRVEDCYVITRRGCEKISTFPLSF